MLKKILPALALILLLSSVQGAITNLKVPFSVRLGENLTMSGHYGTADVLCKFMILDSNGFFVERLTDEYTFDNGSFYAERVMVEPPYYRGDDFNVIITCGTDSISQLFTVEQPVSLAHPIQMWWEYSFQEPNKDAIMFLASFVGLIVLSAFVIVIAIKKGKSYAS